MTGKNTDPVAAGQERRSAVYGVVRNDVEATRIPMYSNAWTWKICDADEKLSVAMHDYDLMFKIVCAHHEKYNFDMYHDLGTRNPIRMAEAAKTCTYIIDDDIGAINIPDMERMYADEYDLLLKDGLQKYSFEVMLPRIAKYETKEEMFECIAAACKERLAFNAYSARISNHYKSVFGVLPMCGGRWGLPPDTMFNYLRGLKGSSIDMRRQPDKFEELLRFLRGSGDIDKYLDSLPGKDQYIFGCRTVSLSHNFMSLKQYERFTWPYMKEYVDGIVRHDQLSFMWQEGNSKNFYDLFKDIPSGHFGFLGETDDMKELKKALPNMTIIGGMDEMLLSRGTPEQCVDFAKKLIDDLAFDKKYIFSTNKMLSYRNDARGDNMKAVTDFIREYRF